MKLAHLVNKTSHETKKPWHADCPSGFWADVRVGVCKPGMQASSGSDALGQEDQVLLRPTAAMVTCVAFEVVRLPRSSLSYRAAASMGLPRQA